MGEVNHIVDHLKLEHQGVFDVKEMFNMFTRWMKEVPYEKGGDYVSEQNTSHGKCIEYFYYPWLKVSDNLRAFLKIRLLLYDVVKVDIIVDGKKRKMDYGKVILYLDGYLEYDYEYRWQYRPLFLFIRSAFIKFFYRNYSRFFEKDMINDCHKLYALFENFFNMYKSYKPVERVPHFYY
jgi:hypothetical protein